MSYQYPFGQPLIPVVQKDRSPKKVFVLGVYASAVHAKWRDQYGTVLVQALAVASEPYIFWRGDGCEDIINGIDLPRDAGRLEPAAAHFNGPSGVTLDELYLKPLGIIRDDAWLCDLLPESRINPNQRKAITKHYQPLVEELGLPECTIPNFSASELRKQEKRHLEILEEIEESQAGTIILLGDLPIKHWLAHFSKYRKLSDFGETADTYGKRHSLEIEGKTYQILPLVHPRQAGSLGRASKKWTELHTEWVSSSAS
jgi:uracil-DNA glycosylase